MLDLDSLCPESIKRISGLNIDFALSDGWTGIALVIKIIYSQNLQT